jgi:hypothetical protein
VLISAERFTLGILNYHWISLRIHGPATVARNKLMGTWRKAGAPDRRGVSTVKIHETAAGRRITWPLAP